MALPGLKIWFNNVVDTERKVVEVTGDRVRIGRHPSNDVVLDSPYIANEAVVLYQRGDGWELVALGINGVTLDDQQIYNGDRCRIRTNHSISLFPFTLTLDLPSDEHISQESQRQVLDQEMSRVIADVHLALLTRMNLNADTQGMQRENDEFILTLERNLDAIAQAHESLTANPALVTHIAGHGLRDHLLGDTTQSDEPKEPAALCTARHWSRMRSSVPERERELDSTAEYITKLLQRDSSSTDPGNTDQFDHGFWASWESIGDRVHIEFRRYLALRHLKKEIKDIVFGYGPLEDLLRMPSISEIMVVGRDRIYVERAGVLENSGRRFISDEVIEAIIQRIVGKVNRRIDKSQPLVDARLSDGSRVNAVIPPLAVSGPTLTIRKFPYRKILVDDLVACGSLTRTVAEFIRAIVLTRRNIIVSGGTGTGKTTLLNCLSDFIPDRERIVTIEDTAELQLAKQHVVQMETKEANVEGAGQYTIRDLVRNALRMRPDRIIVGECRGPEALDMLQAMNTGHDGSLTTIHANAAPDVLLRLEVLVQMAADLPISSIDQQIGSAIDIIIQLQRLRDGRRVISQITECVGVNPHTRQIELRDLYLREATDKAELQPTGLLPSFIGELIENSTLRLDSFYLEPTT